jgi:hypothetical protein
MPFGILLLQPPPILSWSPRHGMGLQGSQRCVLCCMCLEGADDPKQHLLLFGFQAEEKHRDILGRLMVAVAEIARKEKLEKGFRVVINDGPEGCQVCYLSSVTLPLFHILRFLSERGPSSSSYYWWKAAYLGMLFPPVPDVLKCLCLPAVTHSHSHSRVPLFILCSLPSTSSSSHQELGSQRGP